MSLCAAAGLALRGEVRKRRELLMYHNVRIHLDDVQGLGTFLEFEAVVSPSDSEEVCHRAALKCWCAAMKGEDEDRIAQSYSDLLGL